VMTSEHHGGFAGYLPNPLQAAGWCLEEMAKGWAAPCPLLLPLRPAALVAEEIAWLDARHPGRVGLGVASGSLPQDFDAMHVPIDDMAQRFTVAFEELVGILDGRAPGVLLGDPAVARLHEHPIPVLSAAMGLTAARRRRSEPAGARAGGDPGAGARPDRPAGHRSAPPAAGPVREPDHLTTAS